MLVSFNNAVILQSMDGETFLWWLLSTFLVIIVSKGMFSKNETKGIREQEKPPPPQPIIVVIEKDKGKGIGWFIELLISIFATVVFGLFASGKQDLLVPLIELIISFFTKK